MADADRDTTRRWRWEPDASGAAEVRWTGRGREPEGSALARYDG